MERTASLNAPFYLTPLAASLLGATNTWHWITERTNSRRIGCCPLQSEQLNFYPKTAKTLSELFRASIDPINFLSTIFRFGNCLHVTGYK